MTTISNSPRRRYGRKVIGGALLLVAVTGGVAQAASVSTTGSTASNSGRTITVSDTANDGDSVYTNWNSSGYNRAETNISAGDRGNYVRVTPGTLSNFRACRNRTAYADDCSSYVRP